MDAFLGADMGECNMFDMGNVTSSQDVSITLYHALTGMMEKRVIFFLKLKRLAR